MAMVDYFYVTFSWDMLRYCSSCITETRQISNLTSQDVSKKILSDLVRKNVPKSNNKFHHFQYATLEMFKGAFDNYSMLKWRFSHQHPHFCNVS